MNGPELDHLLSDRHLDELVTTFRRLTGAQESAACVCVLIDPLLDNPLPILEAIEQRPRHPLRIKHDDLALEDAPYLLKVGQEQDHERLLECSLHQALAEQRVAATTTPAPRAVCAWILIEEHDLPRLLDALSSLAIVRPPERSAQRTIFRYWDPRVFEHLPRILGQQTMQTLLTQDVTARWLWLDREGQLASQEFKGGQGWRPDVQQWQALSRVEDLNQCLVLTHSAEKAPSSHDVIRLDKALQHAISLGCRTSIDRMTYALLADSLGGSFEHHPLMVDTFRQIAQEQASLSALAEAIPQDTWDRIKIDLSQPHQESVR